MTQFMYGAAYEGRTATLLTNGKVLVAGGENMDTGEYSSAEVYELSSGTFTSTGDMTTARFQHTATALSNGAILIAGGGTIDCTQITPCGLGTAARADLYDPSTGTFTSTGDMTTARNGHTAALLSDGTVLMSGGYSRGGVRPS